MSEDEPRRAVGTGDFAAPPQVPDGIEVQAPLPEPFDLRPPTPAQMRQRTLRTMRVLQRHVGPLVAKRALRRPLQPLDVARPLRRAFRDLGATYVKLGQLIASAPGVFGEEISEEFRSLLDEGTPVDFNHIERELHTAFGRPIGEVFSEFDSTPVGRASMAVVHKAKLRTGEEVAVKVLRPGIERKIAADFALMRRVIPRIASRVAGAQGDMIEPMLKGLREQLSEELDLRNEARIMNHFNELLQLVDLPHIAVPHVHDDLSTRRVLVMEWFDGAPIDDLGAAAEFGYDPKPLVVDIVKGFFLTSIRYGIFHGDVHAGNLMLLRDGRIGVLDWGIVGRLTPDAHEHFRNIIRAALGREDAWPAVTSRIAEQIGPLIEHRLGVPADQIEPLIRSVLEPMFTKPFGEVKLSTLLLGPEELRGPDGKPTGGLAGAGGATPDVPGMDPNAFDRSMLLLAKQLLYFERYGQMYLSDISLMSDRDFFEALVDEPTATP